MRVPAAVPRTESRGLVDVGRSEDEVHAVCVFGQRAAAEGAGHYRLYPRVTQRRALRITVRGARSKSDRVRKMRVAA